MKICSGWFLLEDAEGFLDFLLNLNRATQFLTSNQRPQQWGVMLLILGMVDLWRLYGFHE